MSESDNQNQSIIWSLFLPTFPRDEQQLDYGALVLRPRSPPHVPTPASKREKSRETKQKAFCRWNNTWTVLKAEEEGRVYMWDSPMYVGLLYLYMWDSYMRHICETPIYMRLSYICETLRYMWDSPVFVRLLYIYICETLIYVIYVRLLNMWDSPIYVRLLYIYMWDSYIHHICETPIYMWVSSS